MKILLYGAGPMAIDYAKVLLAMNIDFDVIGRGESSAKIFHEKIGKQVLINPTLNATDYDAAIVAVSMEQLGTVTEQLLALNFNKILVEKPGGINAEEIEKISKLCIEKNATILLAYNRRFYASVLAAENVIKNDGGISSIHFEFTEWSHVIEPLIKADGVKENWFLGNSTHVVDLAFYLAGNPEKISCYKSGKLAWHSAGAAFVGSGVTNKNVLFSYNANWNAPGRWGVEVMTNQHRLILRPLEKLQIQKKGSVAIEEFLIDDVLDKKFKPGLYKQTEAFLNNNFESFCTLKEQAENANGIYNKMMNCIE
jgi:predicted dehydrogenase